MLLKTLLATVCLIGCVVAQNSPVFLWGVPTDAKPSLAALPQREFASLIKPLLQDYTVVAFLEEDLSARDLSCHNVNNAQSCYAYLRKVTPKTYYANVENPVEVLRSLAIEREHNSIDAAGEWSQSVELKTGKVIFVSFDSLPLQRGAALEAHDAAIQSASKALKGKVVYLYLATSPSGSSHSSIGSRVTRATAATTGGYIFRKGAQFLLFFSKFTYKNNEGQAQVAVFNGDMQVTNATDNPNLFSVSMTATSGKILKFNITYKSGYYYMQDVEFDGVKFRNNDMNAPTSFSYHCGNLELKAVSGLTQPNNARIHWESLQFQAPFGRTEDPKFVFGDSWDCVYFFTPGIMSALFVGIVLLMVLFTGVCWMMDINTMDRFEDPKGKTITVNTATE